VKLAEAVVDGAIGYAVTCIGQAGAIKQVFEDGQPPALHTGITMTPG